MWVDGEDTDDAGPVQILWHCFVLYYKRHQPWCFVFLASFSSSFKISLLPLKSPLSFVLHPSALLSLLLLFFWGPQCWASVSMAERFKLVPRVSSSAPLSSITRSPHTQEPITQPLETPPHLNLHPRPDATALGCESVCVIGGNEGVFICLGSRLMTVLQEWGLKHPLNDIIISKITKWKSDKYKGSLVDLLRQASLLFLLKHSVWDFISVVVSRWVQELPEVQFESCNLC